MVIDHIAAYTLTEIPLFNNAYAVAFNTDISVVWLMRTVGRLAFPLCLILRSNWLKFSFYAFYPVHLLICGG